MVIYKITNIINNKIYIGKDTKNIKNYYGSGKLIKLAIIKYGIQNFNKEILETCLNKLELCEREKYWIKFYNSTNKNIGYNINNGGNGGREYGFKVTEETKDKIRKANIGRINSEERNNNISKSLKGKSKDENFKTKVSNGIKNSSKYKLSREKLKGIKHSEEHKQKISNSLTGEKNHFFGKKHSEETIKKMSQKKYIQIPNNIIDGIKLMRKNKCTYNDIKIKYGYSFTKIVSILNGK